MMRTVFMGTPEFAVPALDATHAKTDLQLVVTQPDRPAGRGRKLKPPAVKVRALELGLEVVQPEASVSKVLGERLEALELDAIVVAAYGKILGRRVLRAPRLGCVNLHASLLPRQRGASPPVWAILSGDAETGVSIQQMVLEMDAGDVLASRSTPIDPNETSGELLSRLSVIGGELMSEFLPKLAVGDVVPAEQDAAAATFARPLNKADGVIDWSKSARQVHDHVRAMYPWPGASTNCCSGRLRVHRTEVVEEQDVYGEPGQIIVCGKPGVHIACGQGVVAIHEAQREGKKSSCATELVCGRVFSDREILGK